MIFFLLWAEAYELGIGEKSSAPESETKMWYYRGRPNTCLKTLSKTYHYRYDKADNKTHCIVCVYTIVRGLESCKKEKPLKNAIIDAIKMQNITRMSSDWREKV